MSKRRHASRTPPLLVPPLLALLAACLPALAGADDPAAAPLLPLHHAPRRVCLRGLAGPACDQLAWPACVVGALRTACDTPAPCACFAQCAADFFLGDELRFCYATNESAPPRSILEMMAAPIVPFPQPEAREEPFRPPIAGERWGDPADCPERCNDRGFCTADKRCLRCFSTLAAPGAPPPPGDAAQGGACEAIGGASKPCINDTCSGHGACVTGVCVCEPGHGGAACELPSLVQARGGEHGAVARPSIFIYNLPPAFNVYQPANNMERNTGWWLWRALLTSPHRTLSARDADFFFVPCFPMADNEALLVRALRWVRLHAPHWNATEGHNHVVVGSWDFGLAFIAGRPEFSRLIQLSHFGWTNATRRWQTTVDGRCPAWIRPAEREHAGGVPDDPASCKSFAKTVGPDGGTHRMGIDIVIPDIMEQKFKRATPPAPNITAGRAADGRATRVFFSGGPTNVWRTEVHRLHANASGWRVIIRHVDMLQEMTSAVFCLDVGGAGFSTRFTLAMVLGCVPVYLDELEPPWAGDLPLAEFSVRFSPEQLSSLPSLLDAIPAADVAALQAGVRRWRGSYHWRALFGPDGYSAARLAEGGGAAVPDALETLFRILSTRIGK